MESAVESIKSEHHDEDLAGKSAKNGVATHDIADKIKKEPPDDLEQSQVNTSVEDDESDTGSEDSEEEGSPHIPPELAGNLAAIKRMMSPEIQAAMGNFFLPQPFVGLNPQAAAMMAEKLASMREDQTLDTSANTTLSTDGSSPVKSQTDVECMKKYYEKHVPPHIDDGDDSKSETSEEDTEEEDNLHSMDDSDLQNDTELAYYSCNEKNGSSECGLVFNSKDMLMYHKTSCHGTPCKVCGIKVYPLGYMKEHMKEAHPWLNDAEQKDLVNESSANNDDATSSTDQDSPDKNGHLCTICGQVFSSRSTMSSHKSSTHGSPCLLCGKRFLSARYMKTHMKEAHPDEMEKLPKSQTKKGSKSRKKTKTPDVSIDVVFPNPATLPDDFPIKKYKPPRRKEVDIPTKIEAITALQEEALKLQGSFEAAAKLAAESNEIDKLHRDSQGNPECLLCLKKFSSFKALKIHVKDIHIAVRNFSCEQCGQTFKRKGDLKSHMNKHLQPRSFKCYLCGETFNWQGNLTTHFKRKHSDEKSYICPICNRGFSCSSGLKEHLNTHTDARPFLCDLCGSTFKSKSAHRRHMLKLHSVGTKESLQKVKEKNTNVKMHDCPHCPKKFRFISELHVHVGKKEPHICKVCQKQCLCKTEFKTHMQNSHRHTSLKSAEFKCDHCQREFWKKCNLVQHIKKMHSKGQFSCVRCDAVFESEGELVNHKQTEHNSQVFPCVECGSEFHSHERLNAHMRSEHGMSVEVDEHEQVLIVTNEDGNDGDETETEMDTSARDTTMSESGNSVEMSESSALSKSNADSSMSSLPREAPAFLSRLWANTVNPPVRKKRVISLLQNRLQCPVCQKVFRYNGYHYRRHLKRHKDEKKQEATTNAAVKSNKKVYKSCEYCGKTFLSKMHYTSHMEEIHPDKSLVCKYCGKKFTKMFHMKFHLVKHETKASVFACEVCGKTYPHMSRLQRHMNAHTDEKKYPCQYCGKTFKFPEGVTQHIKNTHHDSGPYSCDLCGRLLKTQSNLRKHMELHFQGKPFLCEYCGKGFARARNRRLHISRLHPEALEEPVGKNSPRIVNSTSEGNSLSDVESPE